MSEYLKIFPHYTIPFNKINGKLSKKISNKRNDGIWCGTSNPKILESTETFNLGTGSDSGF